MWPRNRFVPRVEQLDERLAPAVTFATFGNGTFVYDTLHPRWVKLTPLHAQHIAVGQDDPSGDTIAFFSFGSSETTTPGIWRYDLRAADHWAWLETNPAIAMSANSDNVLFASESDGTYEYNDTGKHLMTREVADHLAAVLSPNSFYGSYPGQGIFFHAQADGDNLGRQVTAADPIAMVANNSDLTDQTLYASFSSGILRYDKVDYGSTGDWQQFGGNVPASVMAMNDWSHPSLFESGPSGTWQYEQGNGWHRLNIFLATAMHWSQGTVFASYPDFNFHGYHLGGGTFMGSSLLTHVQAIVM